VTSLFAFVDNERVLPYQVSNDESESSWWWEKIWGNRQKALQGIDVNKNITPMIEILNVHHISAILVIFLLVVLDFLSSVCFEMLVNDKGIPFPVFDNSQKSVGSLYSSSSKTQRLLLAV
jgi:hypothetical protein